MFPVLSTRSKPLALPLLWERTGCWPVKTTRATISDAMRPIYSSSCPNNRMKLNGQSGGLKKGKYSELPPKDSASSKSVGASLDRSCPLFLLAMASLFSTGDILFVVTVSSSQRVSLRSSCQQLTFQTCFTSETAGRFRLHRCSQACVEPYGPRRARIPAIL